MASRRATGTTSLSTVSARTCRRRRTTSARARRRTTRRWRRPRWLVGGGIKVFAGQRDDPYSTSARSSTWRVAAVQSVPASASGRGRPRRDRADYAHDRDQMPISQLMRSNTTIGIYASASQRRRQSHARTERRTATDRGCRSRARQPADPRAVIPLGKDLWNRGSRGRRPVRLLLTPTPRSPGSRTCCTEVSRRSRPPRCSTYRDPATGVPGLNFTGPTRFGLLRCVGPASACRSGSGAGGRLRRLPERTAADGCIVDIRLRVRAGLRAGARRRARPAEPEPEQPAR